MNRLSGKITLDFHTGEPLYLQIARQIQQLVLSGHLVPGDQLPTVRELATELRINFNTVSRAYRLLHEDRLISTQRGRGTYIWDHPTTESLQQLRQISLEELTRNYLTKLAQLGCSPQEALDELNRLIATGDPTQSNLAPDPKPNSEV